MLIVDDEETIRWALRELFMQDGWEVHCASDGAEAALMVEGTAYDYMITDLRMSGLNGVELIWEARRRSPRMGVTVLTGYPSLETAVEALRLGAWDYMAKPCKVSCLKERVDEFFRQAEPIQAPARRPAPLQQADLRAFLDGAGTEIMSASPLHPADGGRTALARLRDAFADLGFAAERGADLLQSCVEAVAALPECNGRGRARAALLKGHVLVSLSGDCQIKEIPADTLRSFSERFDVDTRIVQRGSLCSIILSEAL
jgi:ActR/RegA family two-component response regulator